VCFLTHTHTLSLSHTPQPDAGEFPCLCCAQLRAAVASVSYAVAETGSFGDACLDTSGNGAACLDMSVFSCAQGTATWLREHGVWVRAQHQRLLAAQQTRSDMQARHDAIQTRSVCVRCSIALYVLTPRLQDGCD
jgi:hypothetical protein